jgi:hypothetical protein
MRDLNRKLRKGQTLQRVNSIRERLAQQSAARAKVAAEQSADAEEVCREDLKSFDAQLMNVAGEGMSMQSFMRFQGMREMHVAALGQARETRQSAQTQSSQQQQALFVATSRRRSADRLVSIISSRRAEAKRSIAQKQSDDISCARFAHGHTSLL